MGDSRSPKSLVEDESETFVASPLPYLQPYRIFLQCFGKLERQNLLPWLRIVPQGAFLKVGGRYANAIFQPRQKLIDGQFGKFLYVAFRESPFGDVEFYLHNQKV